MKPIVILKVALLVLMLAGVIFAMRSMSESSAAKFFGALGIDPSNSYANGVPATRVPGVGESKLSICKTRVRAVVWPDGRRVEESRQEIRAKWMAVDPTPREIGSLDVEKWFSRHCEIVIRESEAATGVKDGFSNFVTFEFIDGTKTDFRRTEAGVIRGDGDRQFYSDDFDAAVTELLALAQLQPIGP
ncbi:MAG: hypothetical protein V4760_07920 [Bdellovibrionota bacterium]